MCYYDKKLQKCILLTHFFAVFIFVDRVLRSCYESRYQQENFQKAAKTVKLKLCIVSAFSILEAFLNLLRIQHFFTSRLKGEDE
jgi:hypothetical protein